MNSDLLSSNDYNTLINTNDSKLFHFSSSHTLLPEGFEEEEIFDGVGDMEEVFERLLLRRSPEG